MIKNIKNMYAVSTNQFENVLHFNDNNSLTCLTIAEGFPWILKYSLLSTHSVVWNLEIPYTLKNDTLFINNCLPRKIESKEWVLTINYLSHVTLVQYWQIFYLFVIFYEVEKCEKLVKYLSCCSRHHVITSRY